MRATSIGNLAAKLIILALGLLFLLPAAYKLSTYCLFRYHAISVDGMIVDASSGRELGGRPFVQYRDQNGNVYAKKSQAKTHWLFTPKVGEKVKIFFDQHDPAKAIVDSSFHYIFLPLLLMITGACFLYCLCRDMVSDIKRST